MRIVQITPGSGGTFYCENCLRDVAVVQALRRLGHDVVMTPMYLPLFVDASAGVAQGVPVFFGGINVYLQQKLALFRKTPRWLDRLFDAPWMLKWAAGREGSTDAADLGPMTLSMLRGEDGRQRKELARLVAWLHDEARPDVVHISNALLLGLAAEIKRALNVPIVCSLQDEHTWLDAMGKPYALRCWQAMADNARHVDAFAAVSRWYAQEMGRRMALPPERVHMVYLGIELDDIEGARTAPQPPVIGYLSRLCGGHGLDHLVEAFIRLKREPALSDLTLRATGGITPADRPFVDGLVEKLRRAGVADDVEFLPDFDRAARHAFLESLSVLSVPVPQGEAFGSFILEALAHAVPVVEPQAGAFPEIIEATGGGVVYDPDVEGALDQALAGLLLDPARAETLGLQGRAVVRQRFTVDVMAGNLAALYHRLTRGAES
ncbi:MAG TPA: glycosyltransferase family 4 protein [Candidatus Hydrogenedentes bacterium]|nr:glycosyltransferase family 4 protein [Candidatus Hydrogenedentota bacterium]HPG66431.1 glycosyltransferase family 4 protein [Candidatus Hydrogenedentota bacterium]